MINRDYSSSLPLGGVYNQLPRVIIINILAFELFDCAELPKLPDLIDGDDELRFWLALFKAKTEEDLNRIIEKGVSIMKEAIDAYKTVSVSQELYEIERFRDLTRRNEASALAYEREKATAEAEAKAEAEAAKAEERFKREIANKDTEIANKDAEIMRLRAMLNQ